MMMRCKQEIKRQNRPDSKYAWLSKITKIKSKNHPSVFPKQKEIINTKRVKKEKSKSNLHLLGLPTLPLSELQRRRTPNLRPLILAHIIRPAPDFLC